MSEPDNVSDRFSPRSTPSVSAPSVSAPSVSAPRVVTPAGADTDRLLSGVETDLELLDELDTPEQVAVFDRLHTALSDALARTAETGAGSAQHGSQPGPPQGPPKGRPGA